MQLFLRDFLQERPMTGIYYYFVVYVGTQILFLPQ